MVAVANRPKALSWTQKSFLNGGAPAERLTDLRQRQAAENRIGAAMQHDDLDDDYDWYWNVDPALPPPPRPSTEEVAALLGRAGNAYAKKGRCPPFRLRYYIDALLDAEITGDFILGQLMVHFPVESRLEDFYTLVRRQWGVIHRAKGDQRRLWQRAAPAEPVRGDHEPQQPGGDPEKAPKPAATDPTRPRDRADQLIRDMLADGRRVEAVAFLAEARRRRIAPRTLSRARKRNGVASRRVGFGPGAVNWLSLPPERNAP
jgi:hypothetical protein